MNFSTAYCCKDKKVILLKDNKNILNTKFDNISIQKYGIATYLNNQTTIYLFDKNENLNPIEISHNLCIPNNIFIKDVIFLNNNNILYSAYLFNDYAQSNFSSRKVCISHIANAKLENQILQCDSIQYFQRNCYQATPYSYIEYNSEELYSANTEYYTNNILCVLLINKWGAFDILKRKFVVPCLYEKAIQSIGIIKFFQKSNNNHSSYEILTDRY